VRTKSREVKNLIITVENLTSYFSPLAFYFLLFTFHFLLLTSISLAQEPINITADHLEHLSKTNTYIAKGSVKILYEDMILNADEVHLNNTTLDAIAIGNVIYEDTETIIKADRIEINLETKLGLIYNSHIFYKKRNYHIRGGDLKKLEEKSYLLDKATVTTCNAYPPEWHISGKNVKAVKHKNIKARDTKFYIKNIPILYTPYFWMPLLKKRQTGLLIPSLGYSNTMGFTYKQGLFWAIKDNRDATFYLDYYGKKGLAKGFDYRYIVTPETNGELWMYHLRDNDQLRDFFELKSYHNQSLPYDISSYLKLHVVNEFDYYRVLGSTSAMRFGLFSWKSNPFGFASEERLQKYLESNLHISKPFYGGRTYLLGQYRQSLEGSSGSIPQGLPEIGFILNTKSTGPVSLNMAVKGTNFWRTQGEQGQRLDIYPNFYFSYGRLINLTQKIGLRETAYFLSSPAKNENRMLFDLSSTASTRFLKRYSSFMHIIEPSLEYVYIPTVDHDNIPIFDSIDRIPQTSNITYSLTNRFAGFSSSGLDARFRVSQSYSLLDVERPFSSVLTEGRLSSKKLDFSINASYDMYEKKVTETISSLLFKWVKGFAGIGKSFRRLTNLDQYTIEAGIRSPLNIFGKSLPISLYGKLLYDSKGGGAQEFNFQTTFKTQCWGIMVSYIKRPFEYQIIFGVELVGLDSIKLMAGSTGKIRPIKVLGLEEYIVQ
jgi:LPS-assembly protein